MNDTATPDLGALLKDRTTASFFWSLVNLRRAYHVLALEARDLIATRVSEDMAAAASSAFFDLIQSQVRQSYTVADLMEKWDPSFEFTEGVLNHLVQLAKELAEQDKSKLTRDQEGVIDLGFPWLVTGETKIDSRAKSILLVGPEAQVRRVMDSLCVQADKDDYALLYMLARAMKPTDEIRPTDRRIMLNVQKWSNQITKASMCRAFLQETAKSLVGRFPAMILVEDLSLARPPMFQDQPAEFVANAAHLDWNRAAREMRSLLVAGLPWERLSVAVETPEDAYAHFQNPALEQFSLFSRVVVLDVNGIPWFPEVSKNNANLLSDLSSGAGGSVVGGDGAN